MTSCSARNVIFEFQEAGPPILLVQQFGIVKGCFGGAVFAKHCLVPWRGIQLGACERYQRWRLNCVLFTCSANN